MQRVLITALGGGTEQMRQRIAFVFSDADCAKPSNQEITAILTRWDVHRIPVMPGAVCLRLLAGGASLPVPPLS